MKNNAESDKPFTLNNHIREPLNLWGTFIFRDFARESPLNTGSVWKNYYGDKRYRQIRMAK
jgi:hypothetical protein